MLTLDCPICGEADSLTFDVRRAPDGVPAVAEPEPVIEIYADCACALSQREVDALLDQAALDWAEEED